MRENIEIYFRDGQRIIVEPIKGDTLVRTDKGYEKSVVYDVDKNLIPGGFFVRALRNGGNIINESSYSFGERVNLTGSSLHKKSQSSHSKLKERLEELENA